MQCPHDYIISDFIFSQGKFRLVNKSFLRKDSKSFDRDLRIFREDAESNNRKVRPE
jgi:hypothetical protein